MQLLPHLEQRVLYSEIPELNGLIFKFLAYLNKVHAFGRITVYFEYLLLMERFIGDWSRPVHIVKG